MDRHRTPIQISKKSMLRSTSNLSTISSTKPSSSINNQTIAFDISLHQAYEMLEDYINLSNIEFGLYTFTEHPNFTTLVVLLNQLIGSLRTTLISFPPSQDRVASNLNKLYTMMLINFRVNKSDLMLMHSNQRSLEAVIKPLALFVHHRLRPLYETISNHFLPLHCKIEFDFNLDQLRRLISKQNDFDCNNNNNNNNNHNHHQHHQHYHQERDHLYGFVGNEKENEENLFDFFQRMSIAGIDTEELLVMIEERIESTQNHFDNEIKSIEQCHKQMAEDIFQAEIKYSLVEEIFKDEIKFNEIIIHLEQQNVATKNLLNKICIAYRTRCLDLISKSFLDRINESMLKFSHSNHSELNFFIQFLTEYIEICQEFKVTIVSKDLLI